MSECVVYVSLGSNIAPEQNLAAAVRLLRERCPVHAVSSLYRTAPEGDTHQAEFLNMAAEIRTDLTPEEFKTQIIGEVERLLGRVRDPHNKNAPRTIDLDIALWDNRAFDYGTKPWHVPEPDILRFAHVTVPLAELAPHYLHPETGETLAQIVARLDTTGIERETGGVDG